MGKYKKRFVTLIELLLVVTVLMMVAGLVGLNIRRAFFEQRFRTEVSAITDTLRLAQDLMLILNTDSRVLFENDSGGGIRYWIEAEQELPPGWKKELERKRDKLTAIHLVEMEDEFSEKGQLNVKFLSGGASMSKGVLSLFSSNYKQGEGVLKSYISLSGYPKPIVSSSTEEFVKEDIDLVTRDMLTEIQPRWQK